MRFQHVVDYLTNQSRIFPYSTGNAFCDSPRNIILKKIALYGITIRSFSNLMRGGYLPDPVILEPPKGEHGSLS